MQYTFLKAQFYDISIREVFDPTPIIVFEPESNYIIKRGDELIFYVESELNFVDVRKLSYTWKQSLNESFQDSVDVGSSQSYTVPTTEYGKYYYQCSIVNTYADKTYEAKTGVITVLINEYGTEEHDIPPTIDKQPSDDFDEEIKIDVEQNSLAKLQVVATPNAESNGTLKFAWYTKENGSSGSDVPFIGNIENTPNSSTLTIPTKQLGVFVYFARVSNDDTLGNSYSIDSCVMTINIIKDSNTGGGDGGDNGSGGSDGGGEVGGGDIGGGGDVDVGGGDNPTDVDNGGGINMMQMLVIGAVALAIVCGVVWVVVKFGIGKKSNAPMHNQHHMNYDNQNYLSTYNNFNNQNQNNDDRLTRYRRY
ncbi:MAG: hypothetical protein FWF56_03020 [Firmicutes bacterium]|nr:hypothetical protein [Bacillota bacterium]MCL1954033.1 hypothetical protein [Bacillota bacterium]